MSYHLERYHNRRQAAIRYLGGHCKQCGTTDNLEFDHINPNNKEIAIARLWGIAASRFWAEIEKCQLLCNECHRNKTLTNGDNGKYHKRCGTYYSYRKGCRCEKCKFAEKEQRKNWKTK